MKKLTIIILLLIVSGNIFSQSDLISINKVGNYNYITKSYDTDTVLKTFVTLKLVGTNIIRISFGESNSTKIMEYSIINKYHAKDDTEVSIYYLSDSFGGMIQLKYTDETLQILCGFDYSYNGTGLFSSYYEGDFIY